MILLKRVLLWVIIGSAGFGTGFYTSSQFEKAHKLKSLQIEKQMREKQIEELDEKWRARLNNAIKEAEKLASIDAELTSEILRDLENENEKAQRIERALSTIPNVASHNEACSDIGNVNLSNGSLRLLNDARAPASEDGGDREAVSSSARATANEGRAATSITVRQELIEHADCATRYNKLMTRYNKLVEWHEKTDSTINNK